MGEAGCSFARQTRGGVTLVRTLSCEHFSSLTSLVAALVISFLQAAVHAVALESVKEHGWKFSGAQIWRGSDSKLRGSFLFVNQNRKSILTKTRN